jgi:hypothetical protein
MMYVCTYVCIYGSHSTIKTDNKPYERAANFKYLGIILTNENSVYEEIMNRLKPERPATVRSNILYHSVSCTKTKIKIYRTIIVPVVLYGCETWFLTLRDQHRLNVSEKRVLRKIFGSGRDEVTEQWGRLHNEEFYDLYSPPNNCRVIKSRIMRWAGQVASMVERRGVYRVLVGRPEGKRPLGR